MRKTLTCVIIVFVALMLTTLNSTTTTAAGPKRGGTITIAQNWDPPHWDPHMTLSYQTQTYASFAYSKPCREDVGEGISPFKFILKPDLAEKWQVVSPTEIVYTLRKGVKFQNKPPVNGRELTAEDVKYTFERTLDPKLKSPNKSFYNKIKSMETPDRYTIKFTLSEPYAPFLKYMALTFTAVVAKEVVERDGDLKKWQSAIGSGPFIIEDYQPNVKVVYARNPDYYEKGRPYVDKVIMRIIKSPEVAVAAFRTKELDIAPGYLDWENVQEAIKNNPNVRYQTYNGNHWARLTFACDRPPFNDKRVRHAASMSYDREKVLQILYDGRGYIDTVISTDLSGALPIDKLGAASKYYQYNPEAAKKLLKEAGHKRLPIKIKMAYSAAYGSGWTTATEALIGQLKSAGTFDITLVPQEYGRYISGTYLGKYDEDCFYALTTPPVDPDDQLWSLFHSTSYRNSTHMKDPHLDKLLEAQRVEMDEQKRASMLKDIQLYIAEQMYYMPTILAAQYDAIYPYVHGYYRHAVPWYNWGDRFRLVWLDK